MLVLLFCSAPPDPFKDPNNATITFELEGTSSKSDSLLMDTVNSTVKIRLLPRLPDLIDSIAVVIVKNGNDTILRKSFTSVIDTLTAPMVIEQYFQFAGEYKVIAQLFKEQGRSSIESCDIKIYVPANIVDQSWPMTISKGGTAVLFVKATGSGTLKYQWSHLVLGRVVGTDNDTLLLTNVSSADSGEYWCIVTGESGSTDKSLPIKVKIDTTTAYVNTPPVINSINGNRDCTVGDSFALVINATDDSKVDSFYVKNSPSASAKMTGNKFSWKPVMSDTGTYSLTFVVLDNGTPRLKDSMTIPIKVEAPIDTTKAPTTTTGPHVSVVVGQKAVLRVSASGTTPLTYAWKKGTTSVSSSTDSLVIPAASYADSGYYTCTVTNAKGSATSTPIKLTVTAASTPAAIDSISRDTIVVEGQRATIKVWAKGTGLQYRWYRNGTLISTATTNPLVIDPVKLADSGRYSVVAYNSNSKDSSKTATKLTVKPLTYSITLIAGANGTISPSGTNGVFTIVKGGTQEFVFTPATGYRIKDVLINSNIDTTAAKNKRYTFTNVSKSHTLEVRFEQITYKLTITKVGNGSIAQVPANQTTFTQGSTVSLTAVADSGYEFSGWSGDTMTSATALSLSMVKDRAVTATFAKIGTFSVNVSYDPIQGMVTKEPDHASYLKGTPIIIRAQGKTGYKFSNWTGDTTSSVDTLAFTVTKLRNITANFTKLSYIIKSSAGANGSISPLGDIPVLYGNDTTFTITANTGYKIASVLIDGVADSAAIGTGKYTFTSVNGAHTISATFSQLATAAIPTLTPAARFNNTMTVSMSCSNPTSGAVIKFTTDGSDPRTSTSAQTYTGPLTISQTTTVQAFATANGYTQSPLGNMTYTKNTAPLISPSSIANDSFEIGKTYTSPSISVTDDASLASVTATKLPPGAIFNGSVVTLPLERQIINANQVYTVEITVTDYDGAIAKLNWTIKASPHKWSTMPITITNTHSSKVALMPFAASSNDTLFYAAENEGAGDISIYNSIDGGKNWSNHATVNGSLSDLLMYNKSLYLRGRETADFIWMKPPLGNENILYAASTRETFTSMVPDGGYKLHIHAVYHDMYAQDTGTLYYYDTLTKQLTNQGQPPWNDNPVPYQCAGNYSFAVSGSVFYYKSGTSPWYNLLISAADPKLETDKNNGDTMFVLDAVNGSLLRWTSGSNQLRQVTNIPSGCKTICMESGYSGWISDANGNIYYTRDGFHTWNKEDISTGSKPITKFIISEDRKGIFALIETITGSTVTTAIYSW